MEDGDVQRAKVFATTLSIFQVCRLKSMNIGDWASVRRWSVASWTT